VPPIGEEGLSVQDARDAVQLLLSVPVGDKTGVIIIGPLDDARSLNALDALLKSIEEIPSEFMCPLLWAHDIGGVPDTIRSRCFEVWAPGPLEGANPELASLAQGIIEDVLANRLYALPDAFRGKNEKDTESKLSMPDLLGALAEELALDLDNPVKRALWDRVRKVARWRNPLPVEVVAALMGDID